MDTPDLAFPDGAWNMGCPDGCAGYELTQDLDFDTNGNGLADAGDAYWNNGTGWTPIGTLSGPFTTTLEGNGHTLTNLFIKRTSELIFLGLFGLAHGGEIRNVGLVDIDIAVVQGIKSLQVGGLVGHITETGSITGCHVTGIVAVTGSGTSTSYRTAVSAGGLAGVNGSEIAASHAEVHVTGTVGQPPVRVGGLVGWNAFARARITTSHASGRVTATGADSLAGGLVGENYVGARIVDSYATGPVSATGVAGGLVGANPNAHTVASYATGRVTATGAFGIAGGLVGRAGSNGIFSPSRIVAVYATGRVTATGASGIAGGLVGCVWDAPGGRSSSRITAAYATGPATATGSSGSAAGLVAFQEGAVEISAGYWDTWTGGTAGGPGEGLTTSELQSPTGYSGIYGSWNVDLEGDGTNDDPWHFGTGSQYPALKVNFDGQGTASWEEFGHQLRAGPTLTATAAATAALGRTRVDLEWTPVDVGHWDPAPGVTYTVTRLDGALLEVLAEEVTELRHTDREARAGATLAYQVVAVVDGEPVRSALVEVDTSGNSPPLPVGTPIDWWLHIGDSPAVEVGGAFRDPENDTLTYAAASSAAGVATASLSGALVTVTAVGAGAATITVTATDAAGSTAGAVQTFTVTVLPASAVDYDADDDGLIEIATPAQLDAVRYDLDGDGVPAADGAEAYALAFETLGDRQACGVLVGCVGYELGADLDFDTNRNGRADAGDAYWNGGAGWEPLGEFVTTTSVLGTTISRRSFNAIFEGNGHTVANLFIDRDSDVGLFGLTGAASVIRHVGLIDVSVAGSDGAGGLVGVGAGSVIGSYATGAVSGTGKRVGGLLGANELGAAVAASYAAVAVTGGEDVGGLVGQNDGAIAASYATGGRRAKRMSAVWSAATAARSSRATPRGRCRARAVPAVWSEATAPLPLPLAP